jgi:UDP-GlcNAc:undecaprenyl-phosphate GlcNAc-1-phosphate transferase
VDRSLLAFALAFVACLVLTPLMRRVAVGIGLVDRPAARKVHTREVPYMGGIAIAGAALVGMLVRPAAAPRIGFLVFVAVILALVGLLDDERTLPVRPRLFTQIAAAVAAVAVGVRTHPTGIAPYDIVITVLWIVAMTNAMNLLDNMDGLAGGIGAAMSAGVFLVASFAHQDVVSALAAGICGACLGFLAFNWRPASIFMGDAGALFLGYALSIAVLEVHMTVPAQGTVFVRLIFFGLPILDTATVVLGRMRHGISVTRGGRDHLSHRLVDVGLSQGAAVAVLVGVQLVLSAIAVFAARSVIGVVPAVIAAVVVLAGLSFFCNRAFVYNEAVVGLPRKLRWAVIGAAVVVVGIVGVVGLGALSVRRNVNRARDDVEAAITSLRAGDTAQAESHFNDANAQFKAAHSTLGSPLVSVGKIVPVVAPNLDAAWRIVGTGESLSQAGAELAHGVDPKQLEVDNGTVPIAEVRKVAPDLASADALLRSSRDQLAAIPRRYLLPIVSNAIDTLQARLQSAQSSADDAAIAAKVVPDLFGGNGTRRYFLAVQNSAELRATGGFIGNWGILVAQNGQIHLEQFERLAALNGDGDPGARVLRAPQDFVNRYSRFGLTSNWQNVNMSPDFPTDAAVIQNLLPQSGGPQVDGVLAVDSNGLAALLKLTGPVSVANWPTPITASNVVQVTLHDAYQRFTAEGDRAGFLGDVARKVWDVATSAHLGSPQHIGKALSSAVADGHLMMWFNRPNEEGLARDIGASGAVGAPHGDSLMLVSQNAAGNKADYFLNRNVSYDVSLHPNSDATQVQIDGKLKIDLHNGTPASGLPAIMIGPYNSDYQAGENHAFVSVYTPNAFGSATLDGKPAELESAQELGRNVYSSYVSMPSNTDATMGLDLSGREPLADGWYRLDVLKQPTMRPDVVEVTVEVPAGWKIVDTYGLKLDPKDPRRATFTGPAAGPVTLGVRLARSGGSLVDRLRAG